MAGIVVGIDRRDGLLLVLLSVLWGGSFFFAGVAVKELPPLTIVLARVAFAAALLTPVMWVRGIGFPSGVDGWKPFFVMALLNNVIPFFADRHRPDHDRERTGLGTQCNDAVVHRAGDGRIRSRGAESAPVRGGRCLAWSA